MKESAFIGFNPMVSTPLTNFPSNRDLNAQCAIQMEPNTQLAATLGKV